MRVTIWHNISTDERTRSVGMADGYEPGHALVPVATYEVDEENVQTTGSTADFILGDAYRVFNVGDDPAFGTPDPRALEYRLRRNRSLSVGDVVQISRRPVNEHPIGDGDLWFACASDGWTTVARPAFFTIGATTRGSTSLDTTAYNRF